MQKQKCIFLYTSIHKLLLFQVEKSAALAYLNAPLLYVV